MWEVPTKELRAVALSIATSGISARFIYAEPPGYFEEELVSLCETSVIATFPGVDVQFRAEYLPVDSHIDLNRGEEWFYVRYEEDSLAEGSEPKLA